MNDNRFTIVQYTDIDLDKTRALLKEQGFLLVDLDSSRAKTMIALLEENTKLLDPQFRSRSKAARSIEAIKDITRLLPRTMRHSNVVVLLCIFVNYCKHADWKQLPNGLYRFTFA